MPNPKYVAEVFRFGGDKPFVDEEGRAFNLRHDQPFDCRSLITDGLGNATDMDVLRKKPCFGRPETYLRQYLYGRRTWEVGGELKLSDSRCEPCNARAACEELVDERIASNAAIAAALTEFDDVAGDRLNPFRDTRTLRYWAKLLHAIKAHGGWTNVNDARAVLASREHAAQLAREKAARRKLRAKALRQERTGVPKPVTAEFMKAVEDAAAERLAVLMELRDWKKSPPWIRKLDDEGCRRTVDVWIAATLLKTSGEKITGPAIAEWLVRHRGYAASAGLVTRVYEARDRIKKLEESVSGTPIWPNLSEQRHAAGKAGQLDPVISTP